MLRHVHGRFLLAKRLNCGYERAVHQETQETRSENAAQGERIDCFEEYFKKHHIQTNFFQKTLLGVGAGLMALYDPHRGDMIATMGETTGKNYKFLIFLFFVEIK